MEIFGAGFFLAEFSALNFFLGNFFCPLEFIFREIFCDEFFSGGYDFQYSCEFSALEFFLKIFWSKIIWVGFFGSKKFFFWGFLIWIFFLRIFFEEIFSLQNTFHRNFRIQSRFFLWIFNFRFFFLIFWL